MSHYIDEIESRRLEANHNNGIVVAKIEAENTWLNEYCPSPPKNSRMLLALTTVFVFSTIWQNLAASLFLAILSVFVFWFNEVTRIWAFKKAKKLFRKNNLNKYYRVFPRRKV